MYPWFLIAVMTLGLFMINVQAGEYRCLKSGDNMVMTFRHKKSVDGIMYAVAYASDTWITKGCESTEITVGSDDYLEIKITTDSADAQTSPPIDTQPCYLKLADDTITYHIALVKDSNRIITANDMAVALKCSRSTARDTQFKPASAFTVGSSITAQPQDTKDEEMTVGLVTSTDVAVAGLLDLNTEVHVQVTFKRPPEDGYPLGVKCHSLFAMSKQDPTDGTNNKVEMVKQDGCANTDAVAFKVASTFATSTASIDNTATEFKTKTGAFKAAIFVGSGETPKVYFTVTCEAVCYINTDNVCFNQNVACTTPGRRRRSVDDPKFNQTLTFGINLTVGGTGGETANQGGNEANDKALEECKTSRDFWIVATVLGCLLLVVMLFALFLFFRLRREQSRSDKLEEKSLGVHNPSF